MTVRELRILLDNVEQNAVVMVEGVEAFAGIGIGVAPMAGGKFVNFHSIDYDSEEFEEVMVETTGGGRR